MIKTFKAILCFIFFTNIANAQYLEVASNGSIQLTKNSFLSINNITVNSGGSVILNSDASHSSSLLVAGTSIGKITYNRFLNSANWYLISAPITSQSVADFVTTNTPALNTNGTKSALGVYISENAETTKWSYYDTSDMPTELTSDLTSGKGYTVSRKTAGSLTFTGNIATNNVSVPLITASGSHLWHSVGNPFPSFLPGNTAAGATNILGQNNASLNPLFSFLYVFNGTSYQPIAIDDAAFHIAPGQAFMVNPKSANESFTFSEALTSHQSKATTFYKTTNNNEVRVKIIMNDGETEKNTTIRYLTNGTKGLDVGYDAGAYQTSTPKYALNTRLVDNSYEVDFTIQVLPNKNYESNIIPLSVYAETGKELTFNATIENLPPDINVFIEDKELAIIKNITTNSYQIKVDKNLKGNGRFYLHTSTKSVLSLEDFITTNISIYANQQRELVINGLILGSKVQSKLYSLLGKKVHNSYFTANGVQYIKLPKKIAKGVYIAKILVDGKTVSKKILIN
ncbi:T9SS type A sorting domain-containing protein [Polaribacter haliotis]|uniref:T9SS type A sorting domain-containing protein n=1 Tax=Polaribacter haliotis TaxID=1888915 RepID=A0A7L8AHA5_9FLAO|nr:T9SS type A sorting domain-containing protein [Polaribacter haliotis]QOD61386.1 T9SS type A sorting domain-containing protein [Polaribacter haliotis]